MAKSNLLSAKADEIKKFEREIGSLKGQKGEEYWKRRREFYTQILISSGIYITDVVKCFTPNNRKPNAEEIDNYLPYLFKEVRLLKPKVVCTLEEFPLRACLDIKGIKYSDLKRGVIHSLFGIRLFSAFNPFRGKVLGKDITNNMRVEQYRRLISYLSSKE